MISGQWSVASQSVSLLTTDHYKDQSMATTAKIAKELKPPKYKIRLRNRCRLCGRPRAYMRKSALCRLCFRKLALEGDVTGVTKSSW